MNICLDELDWSKPFVWLEGDNASWFHATLISDKIWTKDLTDVQKEAGVSHAILVDCKLDATGMHQIRLVTAEGLSEKKKRRLYNISTVEDVLAPLGELEHPEEVQSLGEL